MVKVGEDAGDKKGVSTTQEVISEKKDQKLNGYRQGA